MEENQVELYCQFLRVIMSRIDAHFEEQKEYIHCKEGCSLCCQNGEYPCSESEFDFLKLGFMTLDPQIQQTIVNKILMLKAQRANFKGEKFVYECPFLIDNRCSVYKYRMIICRTFGLAYYENEKGKNTIKSPFCMENGLNYSDVYDKKSKTFSKSLYEKTGFKKEPTAFNLGRNSLMKKFGKEVMNIDFGEDKALLDWL